MDMTRIFGIAAVLVGLVLLAYTWQISGAALEPLAATIGGYARITVLFGAAGIVAIIAGCTAYYMGKSTA